MEQFNRIRIWKGIVVATLGTVVVILFLLTYRYPAWDFRNNLWGPTHLLLQGEQPYNLEALEQLSATWGLPFHRSIWFPTIVGLGLPLGALPLPNAANIWLLISVLATLVSAALIHRKTAPGSRPQALWLVGLTVMLFAPLYAHLSQGQASLLVLVSVVVGWVLLERDHPYWAGIVLSLGWAKPQLAILIWPALAWLVVQRGQTRRVGLGWVAGSLVQTLPLWILDPTWPAGYVEALRANPNWLQPNLRSLVASWSNSEAVGWLVALLALGIGAVWLSRLWRRTSTVFALAWTLALTCTLSPFSWSYDQVLLLPLLIITLASAHPGPRRTAAWAAFIICQIVYLALRMQTSSDIWYAWYPPVLLVLSAWLSPPLYSQQSEPSE